MAIPANVIHVVLRGSLPGGEVFAAGVWLDDTDPDGPVTAQQFANTLASGGSTTFTAVLTAARGLISNQAVYRSIDVYYYRGGNAASDVGTAAINLVGTGGSTCLPDQCAFVTTYRSANKTRSGRGRTYWPAQWGGLQGTDGQVLPSNPTALVNALYNWLVASGGIGVVVSPTRTAKYPMTGVDADRVLDTQRNRAKSVSTSRIIGS